MCTIKTPFGRFSFGATPLQSGPAHQVYVLEGPSESVGKTDQDLSPAYCWNAIFGPLRPVVTHTCHWSNTVSQDFVCIFTAPVLLYIPVKGLIAHVSNITIQFVPTTCLTTHTAGRLADSNWKDLHLDLDLSPKGDSRVNLPNYSIG